ncbi:recombinase family protein [Paenibacillus cellulositrophicus]|uniref:recombinase family protein n=1 Tax=Paenibacillus cellulositrophicus TaxID=562959 RepID=UPI00203A8702|nr:recombinase family protein [Paenibacillus cellulositrophicus]MCM2996954.1 recombinase family protein [Paenibacillus cellulositrophicus]
MKIGNGRVSAKDRNPERQLVKFRELGIEDRFIFIDKKSGKDFDRPRYQAMRLMIREGDLVYVDALDRLGRDYDGIIREWKNGQITATEAMRLIDMKKTTFYRRIREVEEQGNHEAQEAETEV